MGGGGQTKHVSLWPLGRSSAEVREKEQFAKTNAIVELNALKLAEDRTFADCARFISTIMGLCLPAPASVPHKKTTHNPPRP